MLPNEHVRRYRLTQLLHCRPSELDEESAVDLDWLLAIDSEVKAIEARKAKAGK